MRGKWRTRILLTIDLIEVNHSLYNVPGWNLKGEERIVAAAFADRW